MKYCEPNGKFSSFTSTIVPVISAGVQIFRFGNVAGVQIFRFGNATKLSYTDLLSRSW
jgi:hypothetical protein